ncbi:isochorismatase family cysteine hydrolase [Emcibacter nanhaiensis]|uniref:Cysteine hydrolase n=1 Tax=Emcibacter nanhaiensis TaxID=1505037 RepID=A0A501PH63_9PROT|nr:isochorismatase family cysteine hydrolase [Emcibacter nanhaiensis]TPD59294.1 cysteine hydrolase [Emcibacter nanhaiensis]
MKKTFLLVIAGISLAFSTFQASAANDPLPVFDKSRTAIVITDPQNDFLAPDGKLHGLLAENLKELNTVANIETLMKTAKSKGLALAVDPLIYNALDVDWSRAGALQRQLLDMGALQRVSGKAGNFQGSGADFYGPYKPYIHDGKTIVVAPHKMYGPESNDLIYQLRARGIDTVILGGLVANLCVDSHMRALMENGFKVYVVKDAVAAPGADAYKAALVNYSMIANGVLTTGEVTRALGH